MSHVLACPNYSATQNSQGKSGAVCCKGKVDNASALVLHRASSSTGRSTPRVALWLALSSPWQVHTQSSRHLFTLHLFANVFMLLAYLTCYARMHAELLFLNLTLSLVQPRKLGGHGSVWLWSCRRGCRPFCARTEALWCIPEGISPPGQVC